MVAGAGIEPTSTGLTIQKKIAVSVQRTHLYVVLPLNYPAILIFLGDRAWAILPYNSALHGCAPALVRGRLPFCAPFSNLTLHCFA